ncbi:DNA topoisomerase III [Lachnotalea sp. AF33-28]|uniref:DNA topoisomerase III n=1 Tax=Lachnotalea sp. AF33-28 TaxID=2292046 RepID=UPI000E4DDA1E|nr:DNA topoisomerase III [Lachnotalea sp. AF33-28]RHP35391.1 DNA topoisomerase III [Lachnotalea sp. AF33-28]
MKSLVIAEKPSVGRDIARVLKCGQKGGGYLEGGRYIVTWGLGHLVTLADPEDYDPKYKEWKMEDLPMMPGKMKLTVIRQTGKQYQTVKNLIHRGDVGEIIIATDAGREGELVARWILDKAGSQKPIKRLWISSVTDKAIREGFAGLKDGHAYDNLYYAAVSRAEADWLVGINATRALTCRYNAQLSCGRVQTPTLAMIAEREEQIHKFQPKPYYGAAAKCSSPSILFTWQDGEKGSSHSFDREKLQNIVDRCSGEAARIIEVRRAPKKTGAPLLYDLNELQRDANRRFGFSAKETLDIMQRLYENHKVLTYPRTDSRYLPTDVLDTLGDRLKACGTGPYRALAGPLFRLKFTENVPFVNNSKVTDHHAIIPTEQYVQLDHMTNEERKIYDLVVRRFLAVMYPPCEYEQTTVRARIGTENFTARGTVMKASGWKAVYDNQFQEEEDAEAQGQLPDLKEGTVLDHLTVTLTEGKTKPPAPFSEATLLSAMEDKGLGTVATRADIIEKLFKSFLIEKRDKELHVTSKAKQLLELVPEDLKKPELTAGWEKKLLSISEGRLKRQEFMEDIRGYALELTSQIRAGEGSFRHDNLTSRKCPKCGKRMLQVKGKNSEMLVCQDRECGHRETVSRTSNARCPVCHKKMNLNGTGDGQIFVCACGYKEKLSAFQERRKKEGAGVSKKDVASYLNRQKQEEKESANFALADALAKWKL